MKKWFVSAKKADFTEIGKKFYITPMTARIIRNRDIEEQEDILSIIKERNPQPTTILILPGCNHGNGMYKQTEMYQNTIREFTEKYM